ncbi:hypothetical protein L226DRAFT_479092 [Lentinus tigrinus ALCF2SS1-7]|uniref:Uncharacterized protein n=1 Tax=Lentinus tigrinus ALCF2SS1-6 TaxID=1328759 RepID=A0A5C2STR3_9APHY|nr:hypothetical protein L227DRAFT_649162 [Lentinus tigrinus ALCF2SS1-6]RPD80372.1 hypothetical protein L226DRAFT_479092 [Lentinus tigrinus ALCF2SS1-7]
MPSSTRFSGRSVTDSPPLSFPSSAYSISHGTTVGAQKLNIVTRVAIEGRAERGAKGADIKMYLKISLPLENMTPGATIPLFPEENLKVIDQAVHPLDVNSTPYNFSSTTSPLLHKAARALNLPARSPHPYVSSSGSSSSSESLPRLDDRYTGQIFVSNYHVSYILPKEFPRREMDTRSRRPSMVAHFMAAIELWAPFVCYPPHAPYLLSIPVPRCLSNHIRLKIFPLNTPKTSSSLASLSSADEDVGSWDLTSDPHVTRSTSTRLGRTHSYNNFADDESSDASVSAGFPDGCGIQGSFPSTEHIRIRWARPLKPNQQPTTSDGRRRVSIREVKGDMTCTVLGTSKGKGRDSPEGIVMRVQYEATCKGVWFPGVATLLGLDAGLDAGDCDVSWVPGMESKWSISGGVGFTGYAVGPPPTPPLSRQSSVDNPSIYVLPSSPDARGVVNGLPPSRHDSSSSTSSLLRAPLPAQSVPDYSFENSPASTPISSLASLPIPSSPERDRRSRASSTNGRYTDIDTDYDEEESDARPPKVPITVHLNMNDLLPPKHDFKFSITGTVLVKPQEPVLTLGSRRYSSPNASRSPSDNDAEAEVLVVPRFRILHCDREHVSCTVRNDASDATLDVYKSTGDVRDAQTRKTVLQRGGYVKCGSDGARVALRPINRSTSPPSRATHDSLEVSRRSRSRPRTPNGVSHRDISPSILRQSLFTSTLRTPVRRDGPLMIPYVNTTITPLLNANSGPLRYAVRVNLPAPSDEDLEWLEFGLALPRLKEDAAGGNPPQVEVPSASIEGVPVRIVTGAVVKPETNGNAAVPFGEASGKDWITWVKVHIGDAGGGKVDILYIVKDERAIIEEKSRNKGTVPSSIVLNALLPSFPLSVGELQVHVPAQTGFDVTSCETNLAHEEASAQGRKLFHYSMEEYFYPSLVLSFQPTVSEIAEMKQRAPRTWAQILIPALLAITCLYLSISLRQTQAQLSTALQSLNVINQDSSAGIAMSAHSSGMDTVTVTTTATITAQAGTASPARWYFPNAGSPPSPENHVSFIAADEAAPPPPSPPSDVPTAVDVAQLPTITPTPLTAPRSENSLILERYFPDLWTLRFELPHIELPEIHLTEAANATLQSVLASIDTVYQLFRRVLHYPLPPP